MTDLTTEERKRLAEFADVELTEPHNDDLDKCFGWREGDFFYWKPDSPDAPQWQLQACLEAVEEAGMKYDFMDELVDLVDAGIGPNKGDMYWDLLSATPAQICRAILRCLEEEDD